MDNYVTRLSLNYYPDELAYYNWNRNSTQHLRICTDEEKPYLSYYDDDRCILFQGYIYKYDSDNNKFHKFFIYDKK